MESVVSRHPGCRRCALKALEILRRRDLGYGACSLQDSKTQVLRLAFTPVSRAAIAPAEAIPYTMPYTPAEDLDHEPEDLEPALPRFPDHFQES